ncbi:MAG: type II toxin-antitoxin system PemK/MazF family toxin, partial [Candidatus Obscuribacterales bacterium]|nr:type II toxin-antitoxin system PemK/MazF family toxin [Candidatus Obscuribacterales bacterium]
MNTTTKPPSAAYRKGDVVLVSFPYTTDDGQTQTKRRPAVLISNDYNNARLDDVLLGLRRQPDRPRR